MASRSDMSVSLAGQALSSPLVVAAGTGGYIGELKGMLDLRCIGAITTKSITAEPREGNPPWRVIDIPGGMLNAVGLANVGVDRFIAEHVPDAAEIEPVVIGSIAGHSIEAYVKVADAFNAPSHLPMVELNVSCPNTADGLQFGEHPESLRELLREVRRCSRGRR
jgi:dihydroorotate dehydrogenase (NAD+) catalytic subunit